MSGTEEPIAKRLRNENKQSGHIDSQSTSASSSNDNQVIPLSNSLLLLNDDCLLELFERLDIETLCRMANVCKRLREIAERVFVQKHKEFVITGYNCKLSAFRRALRKYGHFMTSIEAFEAHFECRPFDAGPITIYCSENLEKLSLLNATINCALFKPIFARLKQLDLNACDFIGNADDLFKSCSMLEKMYFEANQNSCIYVVQNYPKLEDLTFDCNFTRAMAFQGLLPLNPQLKRLHIMTLADDFYVAYAVEYAKNLERLRIQPGFMSSTPKTQTKRGLLQLAKLKKLKMLSIDAGYEIYAKLLAPLIDAFVKGKVALDALDLGEFEIGSKEIKSITNLKTLEMLWLDTIKRASVQNLISLTTDLPLLKNLRLFFQYGSSSRITIDGLTRMVEAGKQLECLILVGIRNLKVKEKEFSKLLEAVQSRGAEKQLVIQIIGCKSTTSFNVPETVQQACIKELRFIYDNDEDECECKKCEKE